MEQIYKIVACTILTCSSLVLTSAVPPAHRIKRANILINKLYRYNDPETDSFFDFADRRNLRKILERVNRGDIRYPTNILFLLHTNRTSDAYSLAKKAYGGSSYFGKDFSQQEFGAPWAQTILSKTLANDSFSFLDEQDECSSTIFSEDNCLIALQHKVSDQLNQELNRIMLEPTIISALSKIINYDDASDKLVRMLSTQGFVLFKEHPTIFSPSNDYKYVLKAPAGVGITVLEKRNLYRIVAAETINSSQYADTLTAPQKYAYFLRYEYNKRYPNDELALAKTLPELLIVATKVTGEPVTKLSPEENAIIKNLYEYLQQKNLNIEMKKRDMVRRQDGSIVLLDTEVH